MFDIHRRVKQYTTEGKAKMKHMVKENINKGPRGCTSEHEARTKGRQYLLHRLTEYFLV